MQKQKPCANLEEWAVVPSANIAAYQALGAGNLLVGRVYGHPTIQEGSFVFTSPIVRLDAVAQTVETGNTAYRLGEASSEYKAWLENNGMAA